jgi:hypothetical protein
MRTTSHSLGLCIGMGLMLVSLFGSLTCPAESVAGVEPTADWDDRGDWDYRVIGLTGGLGIIGMIGRMGGCGLHCLIATPFTKARSVSCSVSASEAPVRTDVANMVANRRSALVVTHCRESPGYNIVHT